MWRPLSIFASAVLTFVVLAASSVVIPAVSAAPIAGAPITYCGDPDTDPSIDTGAGTMITCDTTITNAISGIDPVTGVASGSATVSVTECTGPASGRLDPSFLTCSTDLQLLANLVTAVDQCNGVGYGGGNVLECHVDVINNFLGVTPQAVTAATVNQCNGSAPDTTGCNPYPANTSNATITQCNNSSYGGGQEDFNCTASGTTTASLTVTVDQCNDSNYGGGSWLNCSASVTNNVIDATIPSPSTEPTGQPIATTEPAGQPTAAPTQPLSPSPAEAPTAAPVNQPAGTTPTQSLTPTRHQDRAPAASASAGLTLPETATGAATSGPQGAAPIGLLAVATLLVGWSVVSTIRIHQRRR